MATTYCNVNDVKNLIPENQIAQLLDDDNEGFSTIEDVQKKFDYLVNSQESLIDSYLGSKYTVPLSTVPAIIKEICSVLVAYKLMRRRNLEPTQSLIDDYGMAIRQLEQTQQGKILLGIESESTDYYVKTNKTADNKIFGTTEDVDNGFTPIINLDNYGPQQ